MTIENCPDCGGTHYGSNSCPFLDKGQPCIICGSDTNYCCSDCRINGNRKVHVCISDACRTTHEAMHPKRDIVAAAQHLATATDEGLSLIVRRDPDMIRDVAKSILKSREMCVVPGKQIAEE